VGKVEKIYGEVNDGETESDDDVDAGSGYAH